MNDSAVQIALVAIARPTFDTTLAEQVTRQVRTQLEQAGLSLVGPVGLVKEDSCCLV